MNEIVEKVRKTFAHYRRRAMVAARAAQWKLARPMLRAPLFVVGCSRAGTTVVYKILSESTEVGSMQRETHDFWAGLHPPATRNWVSHALDAGLATPSDRDAVSQYFFSHTGRLRIVDKNNQNGLCVPYLHALFPDARFVFVKRNPGDNIHSLIEGWGKPDEFATWSAQLPVRVRVEGGRYTRWCFFLFEGWQRYVEAPIEDVCAAQYVAINRAILNARRIVPATQWVEISHEDLLSDPREALSRVFETYGYPFTAELERRCEAVLSKPFNAFSAIRADKWRDQHNRQRIERVLPGVVSVAADMGYSL